MRFRQRSNELARSNYNGQGGKWQGHNHELAREHVFWRGHNDELKHVFGEVIIAGGNGVSLFFFFRLKKEPRVVGCERSSCELS